LHSTDAGRAAALTTFIVILCYTCVTAFHQHVEVRSCGQRLLKFSSNCVATVAVVVVVIVKGKVKEVDLFSAFIVVPHTQGAQVRITQFLPANYTVPASTS